RDDGWNSEGKDLHIHRVEHPAAEASPKGVLLPRLQFRIPTGRMMIIARRRCLKRHGVFPLAFPVTCSRFFACCHSSATLALKTPPAARFSSPSPACFPAHG